MLYETLLSSPGMNDGIKITFSMARKNASLLSKVIEAGLHAKDENMLLAQANNSKEVTAEINGFCAELLSKAGLLEMNDRLSSLQVR